MTNYPQKKKINEDELVSFLYKKLKQPTNGDNLAIVSGLGGIALVGIWLLGPSPAEHLIGWETFSISLCMCGAEIVIPPLLLIIYFWRGSATSILYVVFGLFGILMGFGLLLSEWQLAVPAWMYILGGTGMVTGAIWRELELYHIRQQLSHRGYIP